MKLQPNPCYSRVRHIVREYPGNSWSGVVFRSVSLEFAKPEQIVDGVGAMKSGGRWNPPGTIRALYCTLNPGTAAEESMQLFEAAGLKRATVKPRLIVGIRYRLQVLVDLPDVVNAIHGADLADLMAEEWQKINAAGPGNHGTGGRASALSCRG